MIHNMAIDRNKYRTGRHVVFSLQAHIVLVTKCRRGAITDRVREEIIKASKRGMEPPLFRYCRC